MNPPTRTHYDNLKVTRDAPPEVIQMAYKALVRLHHPDRNRNSAESLAAMQAINLSYAVLRDPERRREHDRWIEERMRNPTMAPSSRRTFRPGAAPPRVATKRPAAWEISSRDLVGGFIAAILAGAIGLALVANIVQLQSRSAKPARDLPPAASREKLPATSHGKVDSAGR